MVKWRLNQLTKTEAWGQSAHASYFANKYLRKQVPNVDVTNVTRLKKPSKKKTVKRVTLSLKVGR